MQAGHLLLEEMAGSKERGLFAGVHVLHALALIAEG